MSDSEELQHRERSSRGGCLLVGLIVLCVCYILSPPIVTLFLIYVVPDSLSEPVSNSLEIVYFPLEWCYENVSWVEAFYNWYMGLFDFP